jgi:hypothetical protein
VDSTIEQCRTIEDTARQRGHTHGFRMMKAGPDGGDRHITWDPDDEASVKAAKEAFKKAVVAGPFNAYEVEMKPTRKGEPIEKFDPQMGELVLGAATDDEVDAAASAVHTATKEVVLTPPLAGG